jgi:ribosomal protein S18 acetylase RimI-like enzyme
MFHPAYNSDVAARELWLVDLFAEPAVRGRGVGRALLAAVAAQAVRRGAASVSWGVRSTNVAARAFYERIGAREDDLRIMELAGPALAALAAEAEPPR